MKRFHVMFNAIYDDGEPVASIQSTRQGFSLLAERYRIVAFNVLPCGDVWVSVLVS